MQHTQRESFAHDLVENSVVEEHMNAALDRECVRPVRLMMSGGPYIWGSWHLRPAKLEPSLS